MVATLIRLHVPRVVPLEIWRLLLRRGIGFSRAIRDDPNALLEGLSLLHRGEGTTRDRRLDHRACRGYRHLVVGGGATDDSLASVLARGPTPFTLLKEGAFVGEAGGLALAKQLGHAPSETLVLDLGQTSIKVSYGGARHRLERDSKRMPRGRLPASRRAEQRSALVEFIAEALVRATTDKTPPTFLVVALPGELAEDGTPGASSYQGTQNHRDLLPDALQQAHLSPATIGVINDAELAAVSASLLPEAAEKTLVLTLGFGLGAALLMAPGESVVHEIQHAPTIPIDRLEHSLGANDKRPTVLVTSGAFNPVHNNHLLYLEAARAFLARANPPTGAVRGPESAHALPMNVVGGYLSALPDKAVAKKRGGSIARVHRTEMLRRATADSSWLMVVGDELNGVELFESVERAVEKALGQPVNVVAVCGADGYRASEQFLPTRFPLACVRRTGEEDEWQRLWAEAAPARQLFLIEDNLQPQVRSATHVRELLLRAADDTSSGATAELREHLHADVLAYLLEQRLGAMERRPKKGAAKVVMSEEHIERDTSDTSTSGTSSERRIALTFDDGPGPSTSSLLDVLAKHRVKATFFLVGKNIRGFALGDERKARELVVREAREGHLLGNHADTHSRDPMPLHAFAEEIRLVDGLLRDIYAEAGVAPPTRLPFRLPYGPLVRDGGRQDERLEALTAAAKRHQHWTLITGDWKPETRADRLATSLLKHVEEMWSSNLVPVIVLHDSGAWPHANGFDRSATVQAVDELLRTLSSREARFITAEELSG